MRHRTLDSLLPSSLAALVLMLSACSPASEPGGPGSGGAPAEGGKASTGGSTSGGASSGGGASTSGGSTATGGSNTAGGAAGGPGLGGGVSSGGAGGNASGGATPGTGGIGSTSGGSGTGGTAGGATGGLGTGGAAGKASGGTGTAGTGGSVSGGSAGSAAGGTAGKGTGGTASGGAATGGSGGGSSGSGVSGKPIGFATLNGGTTGGVAGQTVTVSTFADLKMYAESATAYTIMVQGTISNGADGGKISVKSNKSIVGVGSTALLNGVGLDINNANNIIVQNLRVTMTGVTTRTDKAGVYSSTGDGGLPQVLVNGGDAISISGTSRNVWIDHCELFSENPDTQTNKDLYDGLIDIKGQTGFITISWCYLHDHHKGGLVGASDTDLYVDRKVTLHHNYYNKIKLRIPMYRGSVGHFFNNYVVGATDASEIRADTCVRMEKNYYEALHYSIYTTSDSLGSTERIDNVEVSRTSRAYPAACTADIPYAYTTALTSTTADVKTVVPQSAGVGKL